VAQIPPVTNIKKKALEEYKKELEEELKEVEKEIEEMRTS